MAIFCGELDHLSTLSSAGVSLVYTINKIFTDTCSMMFFLSNFSSASIKIFSITPITFYIIKYKSRIYLNSLSMCIIVKNKMISTH